MKSARKSPRKSVTFKPTGAVADMLTNFLRNKPRGSKTKLLNEATAEKLGPGQPKLYDRYKIIHDENERNRP